MGNQLNDQYSINYVQKEIKSQQMSNQSIILDKESEKESSSKQLKMASKFEITMKLNLISKKIEVQYQWITASKKGHKISQQILELIVTHFFVNHSNHLQTQGIKVFGLTEFSHNGTTYRAHPLYKNERPWFDWVMVAWTVPSKSKIQSNGNDGCVEYIELKNSMSNAGGSKNLAMLIPVQLICIIKDETDNLFAIVHSCLQYRKKISVLTY